MKREFVSGNNSEEKFNSINRTLKHFYPRLHKKIIGIIPPSPMFTYVPKAFEDGTIARFVLPARGKITKIAMAVMQYHGKNGASFECGTVTKGTEMAYKFTTKKPIEIVDLDKDVEAGDIVYLSITDPGLAEGISVGMLYEIERAESKIKHFLMEELEDLTNGS